MTRLLPVSLPSQNNRPLLGGLTELSTTLLPKPLTMTTVQSIIPNDLHPLLRHMPQHPLNELLRAESHRLHFPIPMILIAKRHSRLTHTAQPPVGDRSPFHISGEVGDDSTSVTVGLP